MISKRIIRLFVVLAVTVLVVLVLAACGQGGNEAPTAPAQATEPPAQPTNTTAPTEPAATEAATPAETATEAAAPEPEETPVPFTAAIEVLAINPEQGVTVARVDNADQQFKVFTTGLNTVPPGVPQYLRANATGLAEGAELDVSGATWTIETQPEGSNATLEPVEANEETEIPEGAAVFTPDVVGEYVVSLTVNDNGGNTSEAGQVTFYVATYVGTDTCQGCHSDVHEEWAGTGHSTFFQVMVDTNGEGEYAEAGFGCARCHTAGYYPITEASTDGWWDTFINDLQLDPQTDFADKVAQAQEGTFESFPEELKTRSNINCESCHGPGSIHVDSPSRENMEANVTSGSCDQCHNDGHFHTRGEALENAAHANAGQLSAANGRAACARCHSGGGFIDFVEGVPEEEQRNNVTEIGCPVCHDPHAEENYAQLRVVGEPVGTPIEVSDAGPSAMCMNCHNARNTAESIVTETPEFPHYSAATEAIAGEGGYDFGFTIENSPHAMVGNAPVTVTGEDGTERELFGGEAPGSCVYCHMWETPGGVENATRTEPEEEITDETHPGHNLIGSHSFNMVAERPNGETVELTAPCQACHEGLEEFNITAEADYDGNGTAEGVQDEIRGLLELVRGAITDQGVEAMDNYPYFRLPEEASTEIKGAIYNYRFVIGVIPTGEGRAAAIHNFKRAVGLLQASYFSLTGEDVPNATLLYER